MLISRVFRRIYKTTRPPDLLVAPLHALSRQHGPYQYSHRCLDIAIEVSIHPCGGSSCRNASAADMCAYSLGGRFDSLRSQSVGSRFANLRPISEFLDIKRISKPADFGTIQNRVNYNLSYFSSNYAAVFVMLSIYSLLTNLLLSFVIVLIVGGMYGIGKLEGRDLDVGFARATVSQLYTGLLVVSIVSSESEFHSAPANID